MALSGLSRWARCAGWEKTVRMEKIEDRKKEDDLYHLHRDKTRPSKTAARFESPLTLVATAHVCIHRERPRRNLYREMSSRKTPNGAIEGTRTPTPLPVHGPEPCASANSATMAILDCNAAAAARPPSQEDQHFYFTAPSPPVKHWSQRIFIPEAIENSAYSAEFLGALGVLRS